MGCAVLCLGVCLAEHSAVAQTTEAVAESLFRDGKRLFQAEDYEHACPKLAQSYQIDPGGGTVLLLAICYEKRGKFASSWARYNDALALARRDQREDREGRAREGLESVEPKLSYIDLKFDSVTRTIAGVTLALDGVDLPSIMDARLPIDPGKHKLAVHAPNYETWSVEVTITGPAVTTPVSVPELEPKLAPAPAPAEPQPAAVPLAPAPSNNGEIARDRAGHKNVRMMAYIMGGVGLASIGVGSYFGVRAIRLNNDANAACSSKQCTPENAAAVGKSEDALSKAHLADAFIGIGAAVTVSAAVTWYLYRNDPTPSAPYASIAPHSVALGWRQSFWRNQGTGRSSLVLRLGPLREHLLCAVAPVLFSQLLRHREIRVFRDDALGLGAGLGSIAIFRQIVRES